jgi:hypothetical protein
MQLLQLMQFRKTESFAVSLINKVIGSDVKINQDSILGYVGLGFDMSVSSMETVQVMCTLLA